MSLNARQTNQIQTASAAVVQDALGRVLPDAVAAGTWLPGNAYRDDCLNQIGACPLDSGQLAEYIAASVMLHCMDGWSYLGAALAACVRGDRAGAVHAGYYAELRAAMSLLAAQGTGVFGRQHIVLSEDANGAPRANVVGRVPTHQFVWPALETWSDTDQARDLLLEVIAPAGQPLRAWLEAFSPGLSTTTVPTSLLRLWGLDLRAMSEDRDVRNVASYRPTAFHWGSGVNPPRVCRFAGDLWRAFEPSAGPGAGIVDRHVLKFALKRAYRQHVVPAAQLEPADHCKDYAERIARLIGDLEPPDMPHEQWRAFLSSDTTVPDIVASASKRPSTADMSQRHLSVISRASLLLRVATGAAELMLRQATATGSAPWDDLAFWWNAVGEERGLWEPDDPPMPMSDLWADVELCLDAVGHHADHLDSSGQTADSVAEMHQKVGGDLLQLTKCERIGLWGLHP